MRTQRGISLVELMIAITLGLLLMLGLGTIFVSINQTSSLRHTMSSLQNSEQMAMMFLETSIRNAGSFPISGVAPANPILGTGLGIGNPGTDTLTVNFVAVSGVAAQQGCSASLNVVTPVNTAPYGDYYTDVFSVDPINNLLICTETDNTAGTPPVAITLVTGVSGMNITYGIDPTCTGSVSQYVYSAGIISANCGSGLGSQLKTVSVSLNFTNPLFGQVGQPQYVLLTQTTAFMNGL